MIWIKICGITNPDDAWVAVEAGANALGFLFAESPRKIDPKLAKEIVAAVPAKVEKVGVFVDERPARIREVVKLVGLTAVQLHGSESHEFAQQLFPEKERPRLYRALSIKAVFSAANITAVLHAHKLRPVFDAMLVDSGSPTRGGTGLTFDWERARPFITGLKKWGKVIVAGGLTPTNVQRAIEMFRPWGLDVSSGVEREPGKKDHEKIKAFIAAVRQVRT